MKQEQSHETVIILHLTARIQLIITTAHLHIPIIIRLHTIVRIIAHLLIAHQATVIHIAIPLIPVQAIILTLIHQDIDIAGININRNDCKPLKKWLFSFLEVYYVSSLAHELKPNIRDNARNGGAGKITRLYYPYF